MIRGCDMHDSVFLVGRRRPRRAVADACLFRHCRGGAGTRLRREAPAGRLPTPYLGLRAFLLAPLLLASCRSLPPAVSLTATGEAPSIRFLLTFDDGPSIRQPYNPTLAIVDQLASNDVQPGIKGLFFVQTGHPRGGGTPAGRAIMRRLGEHGQVLGLHSVSPRGHIDHTQVTPAALVRELRESKELLRGLTGVPTLFVRPPFGAYNPGTQAIYADADLHMLMSDIRARDGVIYGYNGSLSRRVHIRHALADLRARVDTSRYADEPVPVVVAFHDVNPYTARHMTEYLHILVEEAARAGFAVPARPFTATRAEVMDIAISRSVPNPRSIVLTPRITSAMHAVGAAGRPAPPPTPVF